MPTVMITGANRGIGLGLTKAYLAKGYEVIATARNPENANDLNALEGPLEVHALEVSDFEAVDALGEKLQGRPIDILINNAGVLGLPSQNFGEINFNDLRQTVDINSISPIKVAETFLPNLELGGQKKLVGLTSRMGSIGTMDEGYLSYRTSKAALNAAMRNISKVLKNKGISVAVLHPGWVKTDMGSDAATTEVSESVEGLIRQIDALTLEETGCYKDYLGETIPW